MYAVIETGGKQYRVELGSELAVERLDGAPGETIRFERVLLIADGDAAQIGTPVVADALVTGEVLRQDRGDKVIVFKYRPKARHRAKKGHRQEQTVIRVADIRFNGRSAADEQTEQEKALAKTRKAASAEAERKAQADQELAAKLTRQAEEREEAKPSPKAATGAKKKAVADKAVAKSSAEASEKPAAKASTAAEAGSRKAPAAKAPAAKAPAARAPAAKASAAKAPAAKPKASAKAPATTAKADSDSKPAPKSTTKPATRKTTTKKDE